MKHSESSYRCGYRYGYKFVCCIMSVMCCLTLASCSGSSPEEENPYYPNDNASEQYSGIYQNIESKNENILRSCEDINLRDTDGYGKNYSFVYGGEYFAAVYSPDNWKIIDSYKINNAGDMALICQALIDVHPIRGRDMDSFRTAEDMVFEWLQHNIAYAVLSDDNIWKESAKDVDFDPSDQGKTVFEIYEDRTGEKLPG